MTASAPSAELLETNNAVLDTERTPAEQAVLAHLELAPAESLDALIATLGRGPQDLRGAELVLLSLEFGHLWFGRWPREPALQGGLLRRLRRRPRLD